MRNKNILISTVALVLLSLGLMLEHFWLKVATEALIMMLLAISFSLLYGHTGLLSFGQGAYFGVGAYGFALAFTKLNLDFPLCLLVGVVSAVFWAAATGYLCVRLAGIYFAIMTVVVAQSTFFIIFQWYSLTGGDNGIQGLVPPDVISGPRGYYYFALTIVSAAFYAYYRLINSPFGLSLRCIRENMIRARFVGIDVQQHRLKVFILSGLFAGLAGVCLHHLHGASCRRWRTGYHLARRFLWGFLAELPIFWDRWLELPFGFPWMLLCRGSPPIGRSLLEFWFLSWCFSCPEV